MGARRQPLTGSHGEGEGAADTGTHQSTLIRKIFVEVQNV